MTMMEIALTTVTNWNYSTFNRTLVIFHTPNTRSLESNHQQDLHLRKHMFYRSPGWQTKDSNCLDTLYNYPRSNGSLYSTAI